MPSIDHAHKYVRIKLGRKGYTVYKCVRLGCSHYVRVELSLGQMYQCWRCNGEFQMNQRTMTLKKPHCANCTRPYGVKKESIGAPQENIEALVRRVLKGGSDV